MESDDIQRFMRYDEVVNPLPDLADIFLSNDGFCSMDIAHKDGEIQSLSGADSLFQYSQLHHPDASNILNLDKRENSIEDQGINGTKFSESVHSNPSRLEVSCLDEIPCNGGVNQLSTLNNCCDVTRKSKSPQSEAKLNGTEAKVVGVCGVCRFTYSTYKEKEDHMKGSDHICKREALSGTNFKMLAGETELLKAVEKLPQPCSVCKKPLPSLQEFLVHHRKHSGKIPFVCIRCKASFTKRSDLIYHIKKHLGEN
uniref:C2H2-type domain-containing protein n=1 Tax=Ciona savignyi TaxID=51511 RepID=H2YGF7_CIOSA